MAPVLNDFRAFRTKSNVHGLERLFVSVILGLRIAALSYWFRCWLPRTDGDRRWVRDNAIDAYVIFQAAILVVLAALRSPSAIAVWIAAYILFDLILVLANVVFVGKFSDLQAPPASIERTIILLLINLVDIVFAFAIVYRYTLNLGRVSAVFQATLVLGTVGYPAELKGCAQLLVAMQIMLDLVLTILLLSSFVGQIGLFNRWRH